MRTAALAPLFALATVWSIAPVVRATPATFFAPVPISPQAIADDPVLANHQTWDLRVDVPAGENWGYSGILATLTAGQFYNPLLGSDWPVPQAWGLFPHLRYDTFLTRAADPHDDSTFGQPDLNPGAFPGNGSGPIQLTDTLVSAVWMTPPGVLSGPGIFTVARLTFTNDAQGSIIGFTAGRNPNTPLVNWNFPVPIPEPVFASLSAAAGLLLRRCPARFKSDRLIVRAS